MALAFGMGGSLQRIARLYGAGILNLNAS